MLTTHGPLFPIRPIYIKKWSKPQEDSYAFGVLFSLMSKRLCKVFIGIVCIYLGSKYSEYINLHSNLLINWEIFYREIMSTGNIDNLSQTLGEK